MKISQSVVKELALYLQANTPAVAVSEEGQIFQAHRWDEVTVTFRDGPTRPFHGLLFDALGRLFAVNGEGQLLMPTVNEAGQTIRIETVNDARLVELMESYLSWRLTVFRSFQGPA